MFILVAYFNLALLFRDGGENLTPEPDRALSLMIEAAKRGHAHAKLAIEKDMFFRECSSFLISDPSNSD